MKEIVYVDRIFADYEDTPDIRDFKEEIVGNLKERVNELIAEGLDEDKAFDLAASELGDISAIADEVGKKKRYEAIGQMYMKNKAPLSKRTAGGLAVATGLLLLAVGLGLFTFFRETDDSLMTYYLAVILLVAAGGLTTYLSLTQETAGYYPMKNSRAMSYSVA